MEEMDMLKRAKWYMDQLAQGIDPVTQQELPADTCLNNVRMARCFSYVSGVLNKVIENGGFVGKKPTAKREPFVYSDEFANLLHPKEGSVSIRDFTTYVGDTATRFNMKSPPTTAFTNWLVSKGLLKEEVGFDRKKRKVTTGISETVGIYSETRQGTYGEYVALLYSPQAQQFLIDNMEQIVAYWQNEA